MGIERVLPRQKPETAASLVQGRPKRNTPIVQAVAQQNPSKVLEKPSTGYPRSPPDWQGTPVYSIGTASRPINLATSSKWLELCCATACASRTRHSSSLIAGAFGSSTAPVSSKWSGCLASNHLLANPGTIKCALRMRLLGARFPAQPCTRIARRGARSQFSYAQKRQQVLAAQAFWIGC
jgi:hypothetical protein